MLASLEAQRIQAERELAQAREERELAQQLRKDYQERLAKLEQQREKLLEQARQKSNDLLRNARYQAEELLAELRKAQTRAGNVDDLARRAREALKPLPGPESRVAPAGSPPDPAKLKPGQPVKVLSLDKTGTFVALNSQEEAMVQVGIMKVAVKVSDLRLVTAPRQEEGAGNVRSLAKTSVATISPKSISGGSLVMKPVSSWIASDAAMLAGLTQVHIIHGKGTALWAGGCMIFFGTIPEWKSSDTAAPARAAAA